MGIEAEMFLRTRSTVTESEIKRASWLLCAVFGADRFMVSPKYGWRALEIVKKYEQDGPTLRPESGETFVRVRLYTRYWGPGYERGDLGLILAVAQWLEVKFPGCAVWYGGDSSGVCAELFDANRRAEFVAHAASDKGAAHREPRPWDDRDPTQMCGWCDARMTPCQWGSGGTGYTCLGCQLHRLVKDGVATEEQGRWPDEKRPS